jgi:lactate permease
VVIALLHVIDGLTGWDHQVAVHAGPVAFEPLASPAIGLLAAVALLWRASPGLPVLARTVGGTAWKPIVALFGFAATSELLNVSGTVTGVGALVAQTGPVGYIFFVPLLGIASGYLAGSGTAANALMATTQAAIGAQFGTTLATVALQNSAAGHAVFASLPETVMVLAIAGDATRVEENHLLRLGSTMLVAVLVITVTAASIILAVR